MRIKKNVLNSICATVHDVPPETGGILGEQSGVIVVVEFDEGMQNQRMCSYSPDVNKLNQVIQLWKEQEIVFCGIFHTHYFGVETLSAGDISYIGQIMKSMPESIKKLYFPLVVLPQREMVAYAAVKEKEKICIHKEPIIIEGGNEK